MYEGGSDDREDFEESKEESNENSYKSRPQLVKISSNQLQVNYTHLRLIEV